MYRLLGFSTQNSMKTLYVLEELGIEYEFKSVNLMKGEQKTEAFLKLNPVGKTPVLQVDDDSIFESGAICRYLANVEKSPLYPTDNLQRAKVDQWMDYFPNHLGRFLNTLYFENHIKPHFGGTKNEANCKEALEFVKQQFPVVDGVLAKSAYLTGEKLSIADLCAYAYVEQVNMLDISLEPYPHVKKWFESISKRESIQRAKKKVA